jgi:hypothetical protein
LVRVPLSPQEAAIVRAAAARARLSVGAWVGDVAVRHARDDAAGVLDVREPSSWRDLVAALVALRTQVLEVVPVVAVAHEQLSVSAVDPAPLGDVMQAAGGEGVLAGLRRRPRRSRDDQSGAEELLVDVCGALPQPSERASYAPTATP